MRDAVVILKDDTALVRIGDDQFAERAAVVSRSRVARCASEFPQIDYVDLRFDERVYVRRRRRYRSQSRGSGRNGCRQGQGGLRWHARRASG